MSRALYFYDQSTRVSHLGGIDRYKRDPEELNEALHHLRVALATEDNQAAKSETPATTITLTPSPVKQQLKKQTNEVFLKTIEQKIDVAIVPDVLFRELDSLLLRFDKKCKTSRSSSSSSTRKSKMSSSILRRLSHPTVNEEVEEEIDVMPIQEAEDEDELIATQTNLPKISLPGSLILALHSTWNDLIENTEYKYKTWQTKGGEDSWNRHVQHKRTGQSNAQKQRLVTDSREVKRHRSASRPSVTSITNLSSQQFSFIDNPQIRSNRSLSRVSFISTKNISQLENNRLLKPIEQGSLESLTESVRSGMHLQFKLSIENDQTKEQSTDDHKGVIFDVLKPSIDVHEDIIALMQEKCKRLLREMKEKIREIPEKYQIEIRIPENKKKSFLQLTDGTIQIYYPSTRLAVLRLNFSTLFFDDTDILEEQFLGLVTPTANVFIMQPNLHARFTTDQQHQCVYLCHGKTGIIEKQIQCHFHSSTTESILSNPTISNDNDDDNDDDNDNDNDHILPPLLENRIQLQLNSSMQLEYDNPRNIRFAFACEKEEYQLELGRNISSEEFKTNELTKNLKKKKIPSKSKLSIIHSNSNISTLSDKKQIQIERLLDGHLNLRQLPMIKELINLRKKIRKIFQNYLRECRIILGVMDITSYHLPDYPSKSIVTIRKNVESKSAKSARDILISSKSYSTMNQLLQPNEREKVLRQFSARNPQHRINNFLSSSTNTRPKKENIIYKEKEKEEKKISSTFLPRMKKQSPSTILEENLSSRPIVSLNLSFACPNIIRQRLMGDSRISSILSSRCLCRSNEISLIHDFEFDKFIELTNNLNPKQLILIGIINSNLHQIENEESNRLFQILQTLHYHQNYGRSEMSLCRLAMNDDYRSFIYDLAKATKESHFHGPLLLKRHQIQPGFLLIYQHGQLIFADSIFNGYGTNIEHLTKQLKQIKQQQNPLPQQFKFIIKPSNNKSS